MKKLKLKDVMGSASLDFLAKQLVEGFITGLHKSPYHGFSVEFAEHRLYNSGESTRHIDWKVYAKTNRLYSKRYEEETNLKCHLVLDVSGSMYYPHPNFEKLHFSVYTAAALTYLLHKQRDAFGITLFSDAIHYQSQIKSSSTHLNNTIIKLQEVLNTQPPKSSNSNVAKTLHEVAEKAGNRSLVILFSDMFEDVEATDELFKALQHLKHNKHEVIIFHIKDAKTEESFQFENKPYLFIDMETDEKLKLSPDQIKTDFSKKAKHYSDALKLKCGQMKIDFIEADVNDTFHNILNTYLIKRSKLF